MKHPYFERYELHRKKFAPGIVWKCKQDYQVLELVILPRNTPDVEVYRGFDELDRSQENLVPFEITNSKEPMGSFRVGRKRSWSKAYMEEYYEPVLETSL